MRHVKSEVCTQTLYSVHTHLLNKWFNKLQQWEPEHSDKEEDFKPQFMTFISPMKLSNGAVFHSFLGLTVFTLSQEWLQGQTWATGANPVWKLS